MSTTAEQLISLFGRIPRRHTAENVKELNTILNEYEDILISIEAEPAYEKAVAVFFDDLGPIRETIKSSSLNKYSKQAKDKLFDEGSGALKTSMEALMQLLS
ncbi:MAG: hypothetical protein EOP53_19205 [Sphingobacteriales bacterium]|nr:MAG: hypothetical protein EOP53_19205 [Sphingobacteriales bacterium]